MNNKKLTEIIQSLFAQESDDVCFNPDEVALATLHSYLFVKPIERKHTFFRDLMADGMFAYVDSKEVQERTNTQLDDHITYLMTARRYIKTNKKWFDKRWFKKQLRRIEIEEEFNETLLEKYINLLDDEKIGYFFPFIVWRGYKEGFFMSPDSYSNVWTEIDAVCHKVDPTLPKITGNEEKLPAFIGNYLDRDYCIKLLLDNIDKDVIMAGYLARALYYSEPTIAAEYLELSIYFKNNFNMDMSSPVTADGVRIASNSFAPMTMRAIEHGDFVKWLAKLD